MLRYSIPVLASVSLQKYSRPEHPNKQDILTLIVTIVLVCRYANSITTVQ